MSPTPLTPEQKIWFGAICFLGVIFAFLLAPFQGNDEWPHWIRAWTVVEGEVKCGAVPKAALDAMRPFPFNPHLGDMGKLKYEHVRAALTDQPPGTLTPQRGYTSAACAYWPLAYVVPGLVARYVALDKFGTPREGGMIRAFWAARLSSWATMCLGVLLMAIFMPWIRNVILAFFSIPEVMQETVALNNDLMLFLFTFVLLLAVLRKPSWRLVWVIAFSIICMTLTKPIFAPLAALALPALVELWHTTDRKQLKWRLPVALTALFILPIALRMSWTHYVKWDASIWLPPWDVHPDKQVHFLLHHPFHVFTLFWSQLQDTFSHQLMRGSWRSILGALGSSAIELKPVGYAWCIVGLVAAAFADFTNGLEPPRLAEASAGRRARVWAWILGVGGILSMFPAIILAMYVLFTGWEDTKVVGVQGRYYLIPLLLLTVLGLYWAKRRWPSVPTITSRPSSMMAAWGGVMGCVYAIKALWAYYWIV